MVAFQIVIESDRTTNIIPRPGVAVASGRLPVPFAGVSARSLDASIDVDSPPAAVWTVGSGVRGASSIAPSEHANPGLAPMSPSATYGGAPSLML